MARRRPRHAAPSRPDALGGVEGNARLTSSLAAILFVLLAIEGVTIVAIGPLLTAHVFVGVLLIPPVVLKIASTGWRFIKYYRGDPEYRRKGPPHPVLRLLGPLVVVLTVVVLATGVALVVLPHSSRALMLQLHQASFVLWFGAMSVHVLGHLSETLRLAPRDWLARTRRQISGATSRQWVVTASLVAGVLAAAAMAPYATGWWSQV
jgi:hypothetical protein